MIHSTLPYFAAVGLLAVLLRRVGTRWKRALLLVASLLSIALLDPAYAVYLVAALLGFWGLARWMDRETGARKLRVLVVSVVLVVGALAYYKYGPLLSQGGDILRGLTGLPAGKTARLLALPVGISYFSFRLISYLVERYRNRTEPLGPGRFLLYLLFFPTFVAGPIERPERFVEAVEDDWSGAVREGVRRIVFGLFKSMVVGALLARWCLPVLREPGGQTAATVGLAVAALSFYIYYDFAGYSDVAIGTSRLLGYRIMENFDRPYLSTSPGEFWRRWHISMSFFLRDYVYIPMGGSRVPRYRHYLNYLVVMIVCGMWHGASGNLVWWGVYHGIGLIVTDLVRRALGPPPDGAAAAAVRRVAGIGVTFVFVSVGWVFFFFDLPTSAAILGRLVGIEGWR